MTESNWSVPETELLQRAEELLDRDHPTVLATIVDVEGNAYRRPGAKMLLPEDGEGVGSITAGCLEDELVRLGREVREAGRARVETYDLVEGEEDVWGLGVGCNGVIDVLLEPLDETYRPALEAVREGRDVATVTVLESDVEGLERGDRAYYHPDGGGFEVTDGSFPSWLTDGLADPAADLAGRGRAGTLSIDREGHAAQVFVDGIEAPPELVVLGTGHDVGPVTELAAMNGFRVTVVGFRGAVDPADRFPDAHAAVTTSPAGLRETLDVDDRTYVVVMTHNFVDDRIAIDELLRSSAPYVGLMGPRERFEEMLEEFRGEGRTFDEDELERLYTPVGLDLGGGSPYQIAHSIVGEVLAVHNGRDPGHLKAREGPIHERVEFEAE